ncbi:MAG: Ca2+-binding RTX toxin-like protein, partial [Pirellulaceae bacterium]
PGALTINNNAGITTFGGVVGGTSPLSSLDVNTNGPFVLGVNVTASGDIDVDVVSGDTTVNSAAQVVSTAGAITINAPSNVTLEPGTSLSAGTDLTINGAGTFSIGGSLQHGGTGTINGSAGSDSFVIDSNAGANANGGTVENILSTITINAGGASDTLTLDDSGDTTDDVAVFTTSSITGLVDNGSTINLSGFEVLLGTAGSGNDGINLNGLSGGNMTDVIFNGGDGDDTFDVTVSQTTLVTVNGNSPIVPATPGDTLNLTTVNVDPPIVFPALTNGFFASSGSLGANEPVNWTSIESFIFDGQPFVVGELFVRTTDNPDRVIFSSAGQDSVLVRINDVFYGPFEGITGKIVTYGEGGNDRISIAGNVNKSVEFHGGIGRDNLAGGRADDTLFGDEGNDIILTGDGDNTAFGGSGNDTISARGGKDTLIGQDGNDLLLGGSGSDVLIGDDLNDLFAIGNDQLVGANGNDLLIGGFSNDILSGGFGNDVLIGNEGNDLLRGNQDEDLLVGGVDVDELRGEANSDVLIGGSATLESSEADLLSLLTNWSLSGIYTDLGTLSGDGDIDSLIGGGAGDELHVSAEDSAGVDSNDVLLPL